ncbi:Trehalose-6-phosphate phosphatase [Alphaproteobacteria bacterium SO-S41]|nr:Trehalose-6-phosphate phosphatase [Alphaproteobacteria bacterium SO-S41]
MGDPHEIRENWALFLDLDGTLLDIAPKPDLVDVPESLPGDLARLSRGLRGALAVVTGRSMEVLDGLLQPFTSPGGAEHGAVVRHPDGELDSVKTNAIPALWMHTLNRAAEAWKGIVIEKKPRSVVVHYRLAPERAAQVEALVESLPDLDREGFTIMAAKMAFEVKPKFSSKGRAVALLMEDIPFAGRIPVFVGDDVTDEAGIDMARRLGGFGLRVHSHFGDDPAEVRAWIARGVVA